jgi:folate-binding protein YgfZ
MHPKRFSLLQIQGPDAEKFLQGQVTCDVSQITTSKGSYGAHCTPKGRVLFSFFILRRAENCFWLEILSSMLDQALKDLKKYAVFFKLELTIISDQYSISLIKKENSSEKAFNPDLCSIQQETTGFSRQRTENYWELASNSEDELCVNDEKSWALLDIQQGIAHVEPGTRELFTPGDLNYPLINAVSFRKGCYTGQEIVARMHYKGKHKRHMHRFLVKTAETPIAGMPVFKENSDQKIGELVSFAATDTPGEWDCLASIQDEAKYQATLGEDRQKMQWVSLPYAIPEAEQD